MVLFVIRKLRSVGSSPGQGLFDMLGIWTTVELLLIALASLQQDLFAAIHVRLPEPAELIRSNGPLVPIALLYSAILVAKASFLPSIDAAASQRPKQEPKRTTAEPTP